MGAIAAGLFAPLAKQSQSAVPVAATRTGAAAIRSRVVSAIPPQIRRELRAEFPERRCAYCHSPEALLGIPLEADHIIPSARKGRTILSNLCLCCRVCNGRKADRQKARDPLTRRLVRLFHPRQQTWTTHFRWSDDGTEIIGLTTTGRATVDALKMNSELITSLRSLWVTLGLHPRD
ncbi:MAG: HNH endonuclease [Blastocatellia bacterium]